MGNKQPKDKEEMTIDEHKIPLGDLLERLGSHSDQGLSNERAKEILARDGPNQLKNRKTKKLNESVYPESSEVVRDGVVTTTPCKEIVVGDVVTLKAGDTIPADLRVLSFDNCRVDRSNLTGDSEPYTLCTDFTSENPLETDNLAFFTCKVVEGTFKGLVYKVGDSTIFGSIVQLNSTLD